MLTIRPAGTADRDAIWSIVEPIIRSGDTYTLPRDMSREDALLYWVSKDHEVFVAEDENPIVGTHYLRLNPGGGGSHVANCGCMTAPRAAGRGIAGSMCAHSLVLARDN